MAGGTPHLKFVNFGAFPAAPIPAVRADVSQTCIREHTYRLLGREMSYFDAAIAHRRRNTGRAPLFTYIVI
jgi:hypothetical protein